ncbi:MAG: hypothetical protein IKC46_05525 [Lachnospiraceae bacterium]|nr:hypothetical protein [Lachnospiraceae bacterium]
MIIRIIWLCAGIIALAAGIWILLRKLNCKLQIPGRFVRWDSMTPKKDGQQFAPVFEFTLGSEWYSCRSFECFSLKKTGELNYKANREYPIFVNPRKPKDMIIARKLYWEDYCVFVVAAFCLVMAFIPV